MNHDRFAADGTDFAASPDPMAQNPPFTIAVVDDDAAIRRLMRYILSRSGYGVLECANGHEAETMLHEQEWDIAILDRWLPDMDGAVLCKAIKDDPKFRARYVILLTGEDDKQDKLEGFDLGADDYITKPFQPDELLARLRAAKRIVDLQQELVRTNRRLELLSITDGLTRLHNHRYFQEELTRAFDESKRYARPLSVALIDIDFFKKVNDTYGHGAGDEVLRHVSRIFGDSIRASDLAARYGGEEFAVMMPETELPDAVTFAEKIRAAVESSEAPTDAGTLKVTVSCGVASYPHTTARTTRELLEAADRALYRAKRGGRNRVESEKRRDMNRVTHSDGKSKGKARQQE